MTTLNEIQDFLETKKMAVAGASRNPKKFGGAIFKALKENGFELYPVNPNADEVQNVKCFKSIADLPNEVTHLYIVTPKSETQQVVDAAIKKAIKKIWMQQKSETPDAVKSVEEAGIEFIHSKCLFMFLEPVGGPHAFHRFFVKMFGGYPKLGYSAN
jgi:hypothetical protein